MKSFKNRLRTMAGGLIILTGILLSTTVAMADDMGGGMGDMNGMHNMSSGADSAQASVGHGKGIIKSLDPKAGTVTITHGPIKEFGWSGMTMAFSVKQRSLLSSLKKGEHVRFDVIQDNGAAVITKISKLP
ncbi:MAG: copper-binding protein [Nitrospiraceae bacterium]|nr:copper-binding protein [Nitrospiraceae bacterium]MDA8150072.1 copper-binding protein [Nitrospiraceae bacterium]